MSLARVIWKVLLILKAKNAQRRSPACDHDSKKSEQPLTCPFTNRICDLKNQILSSRNYLELNRHFFEQQSRLSNWKFSPENSIGNLRNDLQLNAKDLFPLINRCRGEEEKKLVKCLRKQHEGPCINAQNGERLRQMMMYEVRVFGFNFNWCSRKIMKIWGGIN